MPPSERLSAEKVRPERLGATGKQEGLYVRFDYGFGTNVHIGLRLGNRWGNDPYEDHEKLALSIIGWERLCELVDEWRQFDGQVSENLSGEGASDA